MEYTMNKDWSLGDTWMVPKQCAWAQVKKKTRCKARGKNEHLRRCQMWKTRLISQRLNQWSCHEYVLSLWRSKRSIPPWRSARPYITNLFSQEQRRLSNHVSIPDYISNFIHNPRRVHHQQSEHTPGYFWYLLFEASISFDRLRKNIQPHHYAHEKASQMHHAKIEDHLYLSTKTKIMTPITLVHDHAMHLNPNRKSY